MKDEFNDRNVGTSFGDMAFELMDTGNYEILPELI